MSDYRSWGNIPHTTNTALPMFWRNQPLPQIENKTLLAFGNGRSYGDSCLNSDGYLIPTYGLNRFISFNSENGLLRCESGVLLADIIKHFAPLGWFPAVVPGTKFVSIGGAIANDIHSKNHHRAGTFGNQVTCFELIRSDGSRNICSENQNTELFKATIGGLGLTGLITWAEIKLRKINNQLIDTETIKFSTLEQFFSLAEESNKDYEYTVAWIDCMSSGRGHFIRGNHNKDTSSDKKISCTNLKVPFYFPSYFLNKLSMKIISEIYYQRQLCEINKKTTHFEPFFFPLDSILDWNKVYGKRGFFQHQSVLPWGNHREIVSEMLKIIRDSKCGTFLSVLKTFGDSKSPGLLSFPMPGVTLAVDFANTGNEIRALMSTLEKIVLQAGGRIYPAKDALMLSSSFVKANSKFEEFLKYKDPKFSSNFWQRINIA